MGLVDHRHHAYLGSSESCQLGNFVYALAGQFQDSDLLLRL